MALNVARPADRTTLRHSVRQADARAEILDWLAAQFTHITPAEMRAAELTLSPASPVADRIQERVTS